MRGGDRSSLIRLRKGAAGSTGGSPASRDPFEGRLQWPVSLVMHQTFGMVEPHTSVRDVVMLMRERNQPAVLVVWHNGATPRSGPAHPSIGIIRRAALMKRLLRHQADLDLDRVKAWEIVAFDLVPPIGQWTSLGECLHLMQHVGELVVDGGNGTIAGVVWEEGIFNFVTLGRSFRALGGSDGGGGGGGSDGGGGGGGGGGGDGGKSRLHRAQTMATKAAQRAIAASEGGGGAGGEGTLEPPRDGWRCRYKWRVLLDSFLVQVVLLILLVVDIALVIIDLVSMVPSRSGASMAATAVSGAVTSADATTNASLLAAASAATNANASATLLSDAGTALPGTSSSLSVASSVSSSWLTQVVILSIFAAEIVLRMALAERCKDWLTCLNVWDTLVVALSLALLAIAGTAETL